MGIDEQTSGEQRNYLALMTQGVTRRVASELSSDRLVLPFLFAALGGTILYSGLFSPIVIIGRLLAQLLGARLASISTHRQQWLAGSTALTAIVVLFLAGFSGKLPAIWLPTAFIMASALLGISNGFGSLVFQELMGHVLSDRKRINLLFSISAASGVAVIIARLFLKHYPGLARRKALLAIRSI